MEKIRSINISGNPWGVPTASIVELVSLAVERIKSAPESEREAAGYFLQRLDIQDHGLLKTSGSELLGHDSPIARQIGLMLLLKSGKKEESSAWLERHWKKHRSETKHLLPELENELADLKDWQIQIILEWLEDDYPFAISYLSRKSYSAPRKPANTLPPALQPAITRYLENEAKNPKVIEEAPLQRDDEGKIQIIDRGFHPRLHVLRMSITLVAAWNDPAHTPLLEKFLRHPACQYSISQDSDGREKINRLFSIREQIKEVLRDREVVVGKDVVTFEEVPLKDLPPKNPER